MPGGQGLSALLLVVGRQAVPQLAIVGH